MRKWQRAHKCIFCKKFVHILPGCSESIKGEEEGYGEKRVCISCRKHYPDSDRDNVVSNDRENWMNLGRSPPKREPKNSQSRPKKNPQKSPVKIVLPSTQKSPPTVLDNPLKDIINHLPTSPPKFLSNCPAKRPLKSSLYLQFNFLEHELLLHEKLVKVPIMKNGNRLQLKAVTLGKRKLTLSNTRAFDTIFQLL